MPIVNLTPLNDPLTTAAGDYTIYGGGGNDTITTGAGNSSITELNGNNTNTNTITTGAGAGAGGSTVTTYGGNDTITTGAGNSVVESGTGNDTVTTAAGNDTIIYHHTGNAGNLGTFTAGTGIDTLKLVLSNGDQTNSAVQAEIVSYRAFLTANMGATGEYGAAAFTFKSLGLTASMFEKLDVTYETPPQMTIKLYAATDLGTPLMMRDGVWVTDKAGQSGDLIQHTVIRQFAPDSAGTFTFKFAVDNYGSVYLDGHSISGLLSVDHSKPYWTIESQATVALDTSLHTLQFDVPNTGGPAVFALEVTDSTNKVVWDTEHHLDSAVLVGVYTPVTVSLST